MQQFVHGQPQDVTVDRRHALDAPVLGVFGDLDVDFSNLGYCAVNQLRKEGVAFGFNLSFVGGQRAVKCVDRLRFSVVFRVSQENRTWSACSRALRRLDIFSSFRDFYHQVSHFDRGHRRVKPLVAALGAGAVNRLFHGICGQHAKCHRNPRFKG